MYENVEMALNLAGASRKEKRKKVLAALEKVGLLSYSKQLPNQLSGGQMQRVAIARAIVNDTDIVLADEPTGALDSGNAEKIMQILKEISKERLVVVVSHNLQLAQKYADRIVELSDGGLSTTARSKRSAKTEYRKTKRRLFFVAAKIAPKICFAPNLKQYNRFRRIYRHYRRRINRRFQRRERLY